tara:strand:- start:1374 stop:2525 length:1152 start_codon:yes stop_codon:yes gene_type:complete
MKYPFGKPVFDSSKYLTTIKSILDSGKLVHGQYMDKFENDFKKFTKAKDAISVSSCTTGMQLFYKVLGISNGDEVIVSSQTHVATAHAIESSGAKPIFVDSEISTGNLKISDIEKKINKKTKAITIVHYLGNPVDMIAINKLAKKYKLFVLEDCALALGTKIKKKHAGLYGDAGFFSFYPVKHMTTGEGGMIILNSNKFSKKIRKMRAFGYNKNLNQRKIPGQYDVDSFGFNFRMGEINASIGSIQLMSLRKFLSIRRKNYKTLLDNLKAFKSFSILKHLEDKNYQSSYYCFSLILNSKLSKSRKLIIKKLNSEGLGTSIYYPKPVPLLQYYKKKYKYKDKDFQVSKMISQNSICLPIGQHLSSKDIKNIIKIIKKTFYYYEK